MKNIVSVSAIALMSSFALPVAAQAQEQSKYQSTSEAELQQLRSELAALNARMQQLESDLAAERANRKKTDAAVAAAATVAAAASEPASAVSWKGAPEIKDKKSGWSFKPRGRLQYDAGVISAPDSTGVNDGFDSEARRIRLGASGSIPGGFGYKTEVDFTANSLTVTDAILTYKDGGLKVNVGQHNTFQSLVELTSSVNTSFLERPAFTDAFGFERRVGLSAEYSGKDILVQGGIFTDNMEDLPGENRSIDGRLVYFPKSGSTQLHFGGSVHYNDLGDPGATVRYRQRPGVHFTSTRFINTGRISATSETGYGLEAAVISGPFSVSGETYWQKVNRPGALANPTFFGAYVEAGFFLTKGDKRGYKKGVFDRVKPNNPLGEGGSGAWQIVGRYDYLDLNDAGIIGGKQNALALSLIWNATDYTRFMFNYQRLNYKDAVIPAAGGDTSYGVNVFGARAQIDF